MIKIAFDDDQRPEDTLARRLERTAELTAGREGLESLEYEVSLFFADAAEIRKLNAEYRSIDKPTDVLSFPMQGKNSGDAYQGIPAMLGDIVICREIAAKQAEEYGHGEEREVAFLFTHGLLHLLGYDHEDEGDGKVAMRAAEKEILAGLGL